MLRYCNILAHVIEPVPYHPSKVKRTYQEKTNEHRSHLKHQRTILKGKKTSQ